MHKVNCVCKTKDQLGESPIWVRGENSIYWVDIKRCLIHRYNILNSKKKVWKFKESITSIAHINKNNFVAATKNGFKFVNLKNKKLTPIIDPESNLKNNRFNDGKCDNKGRFYAGTMNEKDNKSTGNFYILYSDLSFKKIDKNYIVANGPTFTLDYKTAYFTDTRKGKIYKSKLYKNGKIKNKKVFISIPKTEGRPDGMTTDSNGNLWVAIFGGSCINQYNDKGKKINSIKLPISCPTSCVFGGIDLKTLFITTASFKLNTLQRKKEINAGSLFSVNLKKNGVDTNKFIKI